MPGTVEGVALGLARALEPLGKRLETGATTILLFEELGLPLPPEVRTAIQAAPQVPAAAAAVATVGTLVPSLVTAIGNDDAAAIEAAVAALVPSARNAFTNLRDLAEHVRAAFPGDLSGFSDEARDLISRLPERLLGYVLIGYVEGDLPVLARSLALLGLTDNTPIPATAEHAEGIRRELHLDRVALLFDDPALVLEQAYGWGSGAVPLDAAPLLGRLGDLIDALGLPAVLDPSVPELRALLFELAPGPGPGGPGTLPTSLDLGIGLTSLSGFDLVLSEPGDVWEVRVRGSGTLDVGAALRVLPPATIEPVAPTGTVGGEVTLTLARVATPGQPLLLFGKLDGTRLTAAAVRATVGAAFAAGTGGAQAALVLDAVVEDGQVVVSLAGADSFLASLLPGTLEVGFDLGVGWTEQDGLVFRGGAGLAVAVPLNLDVGPASLDRLDLAVRVVPGSTPTVAALDLGPVAVSFRFLPPRGLGLSVEAGPIRGGGFIRFDEATGRYDGIFELAIGEIGITAIGLLDTRLPGGREGFALLVILHGQFPPIQVGFGFTLTAVGGLLALNRRADVDALRSRMASGTAGRILAPEDPVRNAPVLLSDLSAVFPPAEGVVVVGPTLQLFWLDLVRFDVGIFIELPGPRRIVVLGSARASVENPSGGKPYLRIRLDIVGVLDFAKQTLSFDAVLIDSHLMEILELTGGAAFRLSWGAEPYVVLTIGGFHPGYSPAPLVFPSSLTRIAMVHGTPNDFLYMRFEGYFAVTSNTVQFGASIEIIITVGSFDIRGFVGFDALVHLEPLHFEFAISASVKVRWRGRNLGGLDLRGQLSGPGPVVFRGRVCFEILWCDICFEETFTLGSSTPPAVKPVASALHELTTELEDPANIRAEGGIDRWVTVAPAADAALPVVSSLGQAVWSQHRAPLDLLLQRFEGAPLAVAETVTATGPHVTAPEIDWFAPGSFAELTDADALNRRPFERLHAGVRLGIAGTDAGQPADVTVTVKQIRIPAPPTFPRAFAMPGWLMRAVAGRNGAIERDLVVPALAVRDEEWIVRGGDGSAVSDRLSQAQAHQLAVAGAAGTAVAATDLAAAMAF
jgi:hypothetical protein